MNDDQRPDLEWDDIDGDPLTRALTDLGRQPVDIDPARVDALERRLRATMGASTSNRDDARDDSSDGRRGAVLLSARRRPRRLVAVLGGAVAACVLALLVLTIGWFATGDDGVVIAAADGVEVVFPDGTTADGRAGLELPDGTTLRVDGFVEIDGSRFGPGSYVVDGDRVVDAPLTSGTGGDEESGRLPPAGPTDSQPSVAVGGTPDPGATNDQPTSTNERERPTTTGPRTGPTTIRDAPVRTTVEAAPPTTRPADTPSRTTVRDARPEETRPPGPATTEAPDRSTSTSTSVVGDSTTTSVGDVTRTTTRRDRTGGP